MAMESFVTVASFTYPHEAAVLKGRLESEGIECFLRDELTVQVYNFYSNALGGVKLQVHKNDAESVYYILKDLGYNDLVEDNSGPTFLELFDRATRRMPLIRHIVPQVRLVIVATGLVVFMVFFAYFTLFPILDLNIPAVQSHI